MAEKRNYGNNQNSRQYHNPGTKPPAVKVRYQPGDAVSVHAHWIHKRMFNASYLSGYITLPACRCSNCGTPQPSERDRCPKCGAVMDEERTVDESEPEDTPEK